MNISQRIAFNASLLNIAGQSVFHLIGMVVLSPFAGAAAGWNNRNVPSLIALIDETIPMSPAGEDTATVLTKYKETLLGLL